MTRVLVLQMCRLGDILQTTPMLRGLRREHPDAEITLVLHDVFRDVPVPGHLYDRLIPFPYTQIAQTLSVARHDWKKEVARLQEFVRELGTEPFDLVLNLTHSDLAGLLTALVPGRAVSGGLVAGDRTRVVRGPWMSYFWASQAARAHGCFNLVDVHNYAAGVASDGQTLEMAVPDAAHARIHEWLSARHLGTRPLVAVQMGASEERKRWPAEQVAEAINRIPEALADIVLVGAADERHLVARARTRLTRDVHDALGETTILELGALLKRSALLLTNDTGTMHVATAMGTRIVDLSTGNVFVHETAPYGEGHFVLEPRMACFPCTAGSTCHHFQCREAFTPDDVSALVRHALGDGALPRPAQSTILQGRFVRGGRIQYRTLWPDRPSITECRRQAAGVMWAETLQAPALPEVASTVSPLQAPGAGQERPEVLDALARLAGHARQIASAAAALATADAAGQARLSSRIEDQMRQLQLVAQLEPVCHPIVAFMKVSLDSTTAREVAGVAATYHAEAAMAARRAERLAALLGTGAGAVETGRRIA
ncbi:MAG: glycosyltransferase family 9 protein [Vicinamibacterales bacterium]|nr:glycosyltransferase family 9 protein [Vicinamibacterales bacterium]